MMYEHEIESKLKQGIRDIHPERAIFEQTVKQARDVASKDGRREAYSDLPSPYQLSFTIIMKKFAYIGVPVIALVLVLLFSLRDSGSQKIAVNTQQADRIITHGEVSRVDDVFAEDAAPVVTKESLENASVDDIMKGFLVEAETDARIAINDSFDAEYVYAELGVIPDINSIDYENII
jgi:hypothetical protein